MREKAKRFLQKIRAFDPLGNEPGVLLVIAAVFLLIPLFVRSKTILNTLTLTMLYVVLTSSLNVVNGYSGQFNVGQAGFYCVGAYTAAILSTRFGWSFWALLPVSGLAAAAVSLVLSGPTAKLKGMYFTIITLGFCEIIRLVCKNWNSLTNGARGIAGVPAPDFFGIKYTRSLFFYYVIFAVMCLCVLCIYRVIRSRVGRAWLSIREDESAALSLGIRVSRYKMLNFAFSAFWAGVCGCFYAFFLRFVSPDSFSLDESFNILAMNVIGGQGTLLGPVVGAILINLITEFFRFALQYRMLIYSALIIAMMWLRPQGLIGAINTGAAARGRQKAAGKQEAGK
ncbi:MAG: branched-chain amino acid ABC transporter permease [Oscillospiraceae bacterium]|nr:branched-chain amino acid ABC transporter permease [Oscillospiraceae bacterium]